MAVIEASFLSDCLKRRVYFNAILPVDTMMPGMFRPPLKTAYLLHGYTGSCDDWFTRHSLGGLSQQNNLAIILPNSENHFYVDDMQREDMYGEFIGCELVDFTRRAFPALSDKRGDTIIGGISMGGYGSLRNGMKYNDVFGHIVALSPAIITNEIAEDRRNADKPFVPRIPGTTFGYYESVFGCLDTITERDVDIFWLARDMTNRGERFPSIYFACGRNDHLVFESRRFHDHLEELGVKHIYDEGEGTHDEFFFTPHLMKGLEMLDLDKAPVLPNPLWTD